MTDRRFGTFNKFGTSNTFGASSARTAFVWDASFDWDDDGLFEVNEAAGGYLLGVTIQRGRKTLIKKNGKGFEPFRTGTATIILSNHDGRFDAWNTSSPLYPTVGNGRQVRIQVRDLTAATIYPLFRGRITNIVPSGYGSKRKVTISVSDGLDYLRNTPGGFSLQTNITPYTAIGLILASAGWNSNALDLDATAVETIPYCWSSANRTAMATIEDLANSFLGYFVCDNQNNAKFLARSTVGSSVANYSQEYLLSDIDNPLPADISRSVTRLKLHPRQQSTLTTLWQTVGQPYEVQTGSSNARVLFCSYNYNNQNVPATGVVIDSFEANTLSTFLGTDKTADCTTILTDLGETAKVEVINNSGGLVYCRFNLEGYAVYENYVSDITYPEDLSTVTNPRELSFDLIWQQDPNTGRDLADVLGAFYAGLHPMPHVKIVNRAELQFLPDLLDIVSADLPKIGLTGEVFRVGGIEHRTVGESCQEVRTDLFLEPYVSAADFMQWDTNSVFDTSTVFGW